MSHHWGDFPTSSEPVSCGIAAIERELLTKPRPMEVEGPRLHQPSSRHHPPSDQPHPAEHFAMDSVTLHTIKLIQFAKHVKALIQSAQQTLDNTKPDEEPAPFPLAPEFPQLENMPPKPKDSTPVPFRSKERLTDFQRGIGTAPTEIDSASCRRVLKKGVAALCAHAGYDTCPESVLDTLTDLTHEYYLQLSSLLRRARDSEAKSGSTGFPDIVEQVFHEMGAGGTMSLHDYYQNRIVEYHENMLQQCLRLAEEYELIRNPDLRAAEARKLARMKEDLTGDITFPNLADGEEGQDNELLNSDGQVALGINIVQDAAGGHTITTDSKAEREEPRKLGCDALTKKKLIHKVQSRAWVAALDSYDADGDGQGSDLPVTPGGDSLQDPGSVPASDIMSPPSIGLTRPPSVKRQKTK